MRPIRLTIVYLSLSILGAVYFVFCSKLAGA